MSARFPTSRVRVYEMYYTFCEEPGCGALDDYADDRKCAERNRKAHIASHRRELTSQAEPHVPSRQEVEAWAGITDGNSIVSVAELRANPPAEVPITDLEENQR